MHVSNSCFFFACDPKYFPHACVAAMRARQVSPAIRGFILTVGVDDQTAANANKFLGGSISIVDAGKYVANFEVNTHRLGIGTYIRLFADVVPEMQTFSRAIYLDCDIWVDRNIENLAATELHQPIAAAHDIPRYFGDEFRRRLSLGDGSPYFNAGVLLLDLEAIRRHKLLEATRDFAHHQRDICKQHDQDALNVVFSRKWQTMDPKWNGMTDFSASKRAGQTWIRHFSWGKPWEAKPIGVEPEALAGYRALTRGTPWGNLYEGRPNRLATKRKEFSRRLDPIRVMFGDSRVKRRVGYNAVKVEAALSSDANDLLPARWFPEKIWMDHAAA